MITGVCCVGSADICMFPFICIALPVNQTRASELVLYTLKDGRREATEEQLYQNERVGCRKPPR